jgi:hypothetical protein
MRDAARVLYILGQGAVLLGLRWTRESKTGSGAVCIAPFNCSVDCFDLVFHDNQDYSLVVSERVIAYS